MTDSIIPPPKFDDVQYEGAGHGVRTLFHVVGVWTCISALISSIGIFYLHHRCVSWRDGSHGGPISFAGAFLALAIVTTLLVLAFAAWSLFALSTKMGYAPSWNHHYTGRRL